MKKIFACVVFIFSVVIAFAQDKNDSTVFNSLLAKSDSCLQKKDTTNARKYLLEAQSLKPYSCKVISGLNDLMGMTTCYCDDSLNMFYYDVECGNRFYKTKDFSKAKSAYQDALDITLSPHYAFIKRYAYAKRDYRHAKKQIKAINKMK